MTAPQNPALDDLASGLAEELGDVSTTPDDDATSYTRAEVTFARVSPRVLEVRLPDDIAEAALRTPDTKSLPDQSGWIRFAPDADERHVVDRAEAWFVTAWRHAAGT
jgi:hypothetical protein